MPIRICIFFALAETIQPRIQIAREERYTFCQECNQSSVSNNFNDWTRYLSTVNFADSTPYEGYRPLYHNVEGQTQTNLSTRCVQIGFYLRYRSLTWGEKITGWHSVDSALTIVDVGPETRDRGSTRNDD